MVYERIKESHLSIFDIDDTLFNTTAKIHVKCGLETIETISSSEYNSHKLEPDHHYDYSEFKSAVKFYNESTPIYPVIDVLNSLHDIYKLLGNGKIILNTGRRDLDNRELFLKKFKEHGIDIDNIHIYRSGNFKIDDPTMRIGDAKNIVVKKYLRDRYTHVNFYDDYHENLDKFLELREEYPNVNFNAFHIKNGSIKNHA